MPRQVSFEGQTYTFPDDATDAEIAEALNNVAPPTQQPRQRNNTAGGVSATYAHGATIGTGDEIAGLFGGAAEAVQSFADPERANRPRGGELTPLSREDVTRAAAPPVQRSAALRLVESMRPGERLDGPVTAPAPEEPTLPRRLGAAAEGAVRGFDETQDRFLADRQDFYDEEPVAATLTELGGGVLSPANVLRVGRVGQNVPLIGGAGFRQAAREGAIYGTGYAIATGDEWGFDEGDRLNPQRLGEGAGLGAVGGAAVQGATRVVGGIGSRFGQNADQRAVRLIDRSLRDANVTPQELRRRAGALRRQGGPTMETVAEVGGEPLQRAARAVANVRGPGQQIAADALEGRTQTITPRVLGEATRATTPRQTRAPRNFYDAREALRTARAGQGSAAYRAAHAVTPDDDAVQSYLLPFMREAPREAAASGARQLASAADRVRAEMAIVRSAGGPANTVNTRLSELQTELADILLARRQLEGLATGAPPNTVNTRAVDYFQRGIRQMERAAGEGSPEAGALRDSRNAYNQMADQVIPELGQARTNYGESIRIEEMMDAGRRAFSMPEGEIDIMLRGRPGQNGLTVEEFDGFMLGVLDAIETKVRAGDTAFVARFMRNENWQRQLDRALGRQGARRLRNRIGREARMRGFDNAVRRPSQTTPMREDIQALTEGEAELNFLAEVIQAGGQVRGPILRRLAEAFDRLYKPGIYNEQVNRALAERLYGRATPANIARLEAELAALPGYNQAVAGEELAGSVGARLGAMAPNLQDPPRRIGGVSFVDEPR